MTAVPTLALLSFLVAAAFAGSIVSLFDGDTIISLSGIAAVVAMVFFLALGAILL